MAKELQDATSEAYLVFECDEFTIKPILNENDRPIPNQDCDIITLNCGDEDFVIACLRDNLRDGKIKKREDIKSHHYADW